MNNFNPQIRNAAFKWLEQQSPIYDDIFPRKVLEQGFTFQGQRVTLMGQPGIWKPKVLDLPISITTTVGSHYSDKAGESFLSYSYRGKDPYHRDNVGLRKIMQQQIPIIYFFAVVKGKYIANWPTYIVGDNMQELTFTAAVDEKRIALDDSIPISHDDSFYRRSYLTSHMKVRLHQRSFRERVLTAYQDQCAFCRLKHRELLDAAHIIPDNEEHGDPIVTNGLSLCKIHHAAFDQNIIGITPDYQIKIREDILHEVDGPMLKHGIQELNSQKLILPTHKADWPDRERLEERFQAFRAV